MGGTLGTYLKRIRTDKGYSLKEAKDRTGISEAYLWQLENGKREIPRPKTLEKLAHGYGISNETILNRAGFLKRPVADKHEAGFAKAHLLDDFERLSPESKKDLEAFIAFLRNRDAKK